MTTKIGSSTSGITFEFDNGYTYTLTTNKTAENFYNTHTQTILTVHAQCNSKQCTGTNCNQVKCTNTKCTGTKCGTVQCSVYRQCKYYYNCNDCGGGECAD